MLTLFDVLQLLGAWVGLVVGIVSGERFFGTLGAIVVALVGAVLGFVAGTIPFVLVLRMVSRDLAAKTVAELRADLRSPNCLAPNVILLELLRRGEEIHSELPVVLDMLVAEASDRRGAGWAALLSAFPDLAALIPDYRIFDPVETCRGKTECLRARANQELP
jgi:hypothetical protein